MRIDDTNEGELFDGNEKRIKSNNLENDNKYEFNFKTNKSKTDTKNINSKHTSSPNTNSSKNSNLKLNEREESDKISNDFERFSLEPSLDNGFDEEFERKLKEKTKRIKDSKEDYECELKKNINSSQSQSVNSSKKANFNEKLASNRPISKPITFEANNFDSATSNLDYTLKPIEIETAKVCIY